MRKNKQLFFVNQVEIDFGFGLNNSVLKQGGGGFYCVVFFFMLTTIFTQKHARPHKMVLQYIPRLTVMNFCGGARYRSLLEAF